MATYFGKLKLPVLYYFLLLSLISSGCNKKSEREISFAVIGDVHYRSPDFQVAEYMVPLVAKELENLSEKPEFVIQTGDFFHANRGTDVESESSFAFKHFAETIKLPFFIAKGNHDARQYFEKHALQKFSDELGKEISKSYYSFDRENCHFIILDCTEEDFAGQLVWLENDLETATSNAVVEHIFVAGHYPLWIVARAGFTRPDFAVPLAALLAKYKIDAYFCGHTHNKTVTVRLVDGQPLTQIMDAAVVEEGRLFVLAPYLKHIKQLPDNPFQPGLMPLEEAHQVFIPKSELLYYWGYQEGSTSSYNIVNVKGKSVQVDWYALGKGLTRSYKWDEPGKIVDLMVPAKNDKVSVTANDLNNIVQAWLYTALWTSDDSISAPFLINGSSAGKLVLNKNTMAYSPFWNKIEVPLDNSILKAIKMENEIAISNPSNKKFGIAHMLLLVKLNDGRFAKSTISQKVLTSFPEEAGLNNFPIADLVESVNSGEPLVKVRLKFDQFLDQDEVY